MSDLIALPGGGNFSASTSPQLVDLSAYRGQNVLIFCATQDVIFCATRTSPLGAQTLVTGAQGLSKTALVADRAPAGFGKVRAVSAQAPYWIFQLASGTDIVTLKVVSNKDPSL